MTDGFKKMLPKRDWVEMTWRDFAAPDVARWIAVLPCAAVEQHGPHLPVGVDTNIAEAYLARVRKVLPDGLPATFLPVQTIGQSEEHTAYPGTLSLSGDTFAHVLRDLGASVHRAGIRKLVLVNSHGGNWQALELAARALRVEWGMLVVAVSWSRFGYPPGLFGDDEVLHGIHAGEVETALMRAAYPDLVRMQHADDFRSAGEAMEREFKWLHLARPAGFGWMTQDLHPSGAVGNAAAATAAQGDAALAHGAEAFVELLAEVDRFDLARLTNRPE
jgi:creatinine amidohydrolase